MKVLSSISKTSSGTGSKNQKGSSSSFSLMRTLTSRTLSWPRRITWLMKMSLSLRRPLGMIFCSSYHLLFLFLKTRKSYWSFINYYSGRRLSGILENVWLRRSWKRSQRRDPKTQSRSLRLRTVRVSSTSSVHLKFLRTKMILMMTWYGHPQKLF